MNLPVIIRLSVVLLYCVASINCTNKPPEVTFRMGTVHGVIEESHNGERVEAFKGIPYAHPPVGNRRFKKPKMLMDFGTYPFVAKQFGAQCMQPNVEIAKMYNMSEDCLTLNIWRKEGVLMRDNLPVIVIIHPGTFHTGASCHPHNDGVALAATGEVIVVSMNYRLGLFGFMQVDPLLPGNLGLRDQQVALRWIYNYIFWFGGDSNRITIMGTSAGAMSVHAHLMTLYSAELFQGAVMDSGALSSVSVETPEESKDRAIKLAELVGCPVRSLAEMAICLEEVDAVKLETASQKLLTTGRVRSFRPTMDGDFLPKDINDEMNNNIHHFNVARLLIGTSRDEGTMILPDTYSSFDREPQIHDVHNAMKWMRRIAKSIGLPVDVDEDWKVINKHFIEQSRQDLRDGVQRFIGTGVYICPSDNFLRLYGTSHGNVYAYKMYRPLKGTYTYNPERYGAYHMTASRFMQGSLLNHVMVDPWDEVFMKEAMNMLISFVKHDDVKFNGTKWIAYNDRKQQVMVFRETDSKMEDNFDEDVCRDVWYRHTESIRKDTPDAGHTVKDEL